MLGLARESGVASADVFSRQPATACSTFVGLPAAAASPSIASLGDSIIIRNLARHVLDALALRVARQLEARLLGEQALDAFALRVTKQLEARLLGEQALDALALRVTKQLEARLLGEQALDAFALRVTKQLEAGLLGEQALNTFAVGVAAQLEASLTGRRPFEGMYVGQSTVLTTLATGQSAYVDGQDLSLAPHVIRDGRWEHWIAQHWMSRLRPGQRVVDVGANFGYYTLLAAAAVGDRGRVASFEPNPRMFDLLTASLSTNGYRGRVEPYQVALDKKRGELTFWLKKRETGGSGLMRPPADSLRTLHDTAAPLQVRGERLDDLLATWPSVDLMKLDAEGAEFRVLLGAEEILQRSPHLVLFMEFDAGMYDDGGRALIAALHDWGFVPRTIDYEGCLATIDYAKLLHEQQRADLLLARETS